MLAAVAFLLQAVAGAGSLPARTLTVCDVLAGDPSGLNGKVISVRGILIATEEGTWLSGECKTHLVTKGLSWGNILWVYVDSSDEAVVRSWRGMFETLKHLHGDLHKDKVLVTIEGQIETRKSMDEAVYEMPYGWTKVGFGHQGVAPAEINVLSIKDVKV